MPRAKDAALEALAIDETVADAHVALAYVLDCYEWDRPAAEREFRRALELNPADTQARGLYADTLGRDGQADLSVREAQLAVERDPLSAFTRQMLAWVLYLARRFEAAIAEARAGIEFEATHHPFYWHLGNALAGLSRYEEAVEAFTQATTVAPGDPLAQGLRGWALGLAGRKQEARAVFQDLGERRGNEYIGGQIIALVALGLGDKEAAISWLQKAADERDGLLSICYVSPAYDPLRADPRFQALLRRMNFLETASS